MSTPTDLRKNELGKKWEGRVVDEKFPLRQWLGGSDQSAVFLSERRNGRLQRIAVKLIPSAGLDEDAQLSRWSDAAKLSHPHLIRLFESGRCTIDGTRFLYIVMEYAEENLAEILPLRPLSPAEASEMLRPAAEALGALHRAGFVHGRIMPSNIMAVGNQLKISADGLRKIWEPPVPHAAGNYDAPEVATVGLSTAADIWSLGMTLVAVLTQTEPKPATDSARQVSVPNTIPQPFRRIALQCLQVDPKLRCTVGEILSQLQPPDATPPNKRVEAHIPHAQIRHVGSKRWVFVAIIAAVLVLAIWLGGKALRGSRGSTPATQSGDQPAPTEAPAAQAPAPFSAKQAPEKKIPAPGSGVAHQVIPEVSRNALNTITGHLKVGVKVEVDAAGNVTDARLISPGPSKYFAAKALAAAHDWKFTPPQAGGRAVASEWLLRFQFSRASIQVFPTRSKP